MLIIISLVFILISFGILNLLYINIVYRKSQETRIKNGGKKKKCYKIVSLGTSFGRYAFDSAIFPIPYFNYCYESQFLNYTELMLKEFSSSFDDGCIVIITLPPCIFCYQGEGKVNNSQYSRMLSARTLGDKFSIKNYIFLNLIPLCQHPWGKIKEIFHSVEEKKGCQLTDNNASAFAQTQIDNWKQMFGFPNTDSATSLPSMEPTFAECRQILSSMIDYCINQNYRPILITPPVCYSLSYLLGDAFLDSILFSNIATANQTHIPYLNYLRDARFSSASLYAGNAGFLNERGRHVFTKALIADLEKYINNGKKLC